jgi:hypothetical protein
MRCHYCGNEAELVTGEAIYPHRPDLAEKKFWRCVPCKAHVGCHPGTENPLGRLANAELRIAKMAAHAAFDPLWKSGEMKRSKAYAWLSGNLGLTKRETHIGWFDVDQCIRVVEVCQDRDSLRSELGKALAHDARGARDRDCAD